MNLKSLSLNDLKKLNAKIAREIEKRNEFSKKLVLKQMEKLAAEHGMKLTEVLAEKPVAAPSPAKSAPRAQNASRTPSRPKYQHPSDASLTWSGKGRKPHWVEAWLSSGRSMDALEVAAAKRASARPDLHPAPEAQI